MNRISAIALMIAALVAGCGATPTRITLPPVQTTQSIKVSVRSVEVTQVSLPLYAESEEIAVAADNGTLTSDKALLWADDPKRAVTQALVTNLADLTSAKVAAEPWPFDQYPDVRLIVRFDQFLPRSNGIFQIAGQYYVARVNSNVRESAQRFDLTTNYKAGDPVSLAAAQAGLLRDLAAKIASASLK
jgi:hypothetical protein